MHGHCQCVSDKLCDLRLVDNSSGVIVQYVHWNAALEGWAMWLLTHFGDPEPWTKEAMQVFLAQVGVGLRDPHIHVDNWM